MALAIAVMSFGSATFGPDSDNWWLGFARIGFSYPFGVWLARKWKHQRMAGAPSPARARIAPPWLAALLLPVGAILLLPVLPVDRVVGDAAMILFLFPPLLWLAAMPVPPRSANIWLQRAGLLSFPLYAVHVPILEYVTGLLFRLVGQGRGVMASLLAAGLIAQVPALPTGLHMPRLRRRSALPLP